MSARATSVNSGISAWVAYDFINSLLIINGSLYFSIWITQKQGVNPFWYGLTFSLSTILLLVILPIKGAAIDRHEIGHQLLFWLSILLGVAAVVLRELGHWENPAWRVVGTLFVLGLINLAYQASLVPYNWLIVRLRGVKTAEDVRRVSGLGESFGSLGSVAGAILGLVMLRTFLRSNENAYVDMFRWLGLLFLGLFVIVYWRLSRGLDLQSARVTETYGNILRDGFSLLREEGPLRRFLWSYLFYSDALLTVQLYIPIFMRERLLLSDLAISSAIAVSLTFGAIGALLFATWGKRRDLRKVILLCLAAWSITLTLFGVISSRIGFFILISWAGILYGALWSASRAYVIEITPKDKLGRTFGFYAVFERCASIVGPVLWGSLMLLPLGASWRYRGAFGLMSLMIVLGILILASARQRPTPSPAAVVQ